MKALNPIRTIRDRVIKNNTMHQRLLSENKLQSERTGEDNDYSPINLVKRTRNYSIS